MKKTKKKETFITKLKKTNQFGQYRFFMALQRRCVNVEKNNNFIDVSFNKS